MIRMLEKNELDKYSDMGLYDPNYKKDDICKIIEDDMILHIVGMLHVVGWGIYKITLNYVHDIICLQITCLSYSPPLLN